MTKLLGLGVLGAGVYAVVRAKQRSAALERENQAEIEAIDAFDYGDLEAPIVVTEEVVVVTEAGPYEIEMELIPADEQEQARNDNRPEQGASTFEMPGRDAGPR